MFARKLVTGLLACSVAASIIGLTAGSASAVYTADPDDLLPNSAADLVGVGSDTSQVVIKNLASAYNATSPAVRVATYAATGGGTITPPGGAEINRPNGSGAGKSTLYGSGNNTGVDFARASSSLSSSSSTPEIGAGLQQFPFALDTLGVVTSTNSNAPATLTRAQINQIYKGAVTNWSEVGGNAGVIKPYIPQAGSGTRSFFEGQLNAENGTTTYPYAATVGTFQENDDTVIKNDPNAIAPFSTGRAALLGTLRVENGFSANRALYNVVRGDQLNAAGVQAFFGETGFLCSTDATDIIKASGFQQLAPAARGGVCGQATQAATTNFTTNNPQSTTSTLSGTSTTAGQARLVAGVSAASSPQGTFSFFEGNNQLAANVPLVSGQATLTLATSPGAHTYTARFNPAGGSVFRRSTATATVTVSSASTAKSGATIAETFASKAKVKKKVKKGKTFFVVKPVKGTVTITGGTTRPTGTILVKKGSKTVGTGSLINGVAALRINGLKIGTNKLTITYGGDTATNSGLLSFTIKASKPKAKKK